MKNKISVDIHAYGTLNDHVLRMITNHNEGKVEISASLINMRAKCYYAEWPTISPEFKTIDSTDGTMEIYEGIKHTLTLTWKELIELDQSEADLLTQELSQV